MPNIPVLAGATGLPAVRPPLAALMRLAHAEARAGTSRLPYAARFRLALCRAWRDAKAALRRSLRNLVEDRIERLLAFLDHLDGDADLEPSLGYYDAARNSSARSQRSTRTGGAPAMPATSRYAPLLCGSSGVARSAAATRRCWRLSADLFPATPTTSWWQHDRAP